MKKCTKCNTPKSVDYFYRKSASKDGRESQCKDCRNASIRKYQKENEALKEKLEKAKEELANIKKYCDSCGDDAIPEADISRSITKTLAELGE